MNYFIDAVEFNFCLVDDDPIFAPTKSEPFAVGFDVRATKDLEINSNSFFKIGLGIKLMCPRDWWVQLCPRSSTFTKKNIHALYGVIDPDYHDELSFCGHYLGEGKLLITRGEKIGQLIPYKLPKVEFKQINEQEFIEEINKRAPVRKGGFGSTG